MTVSAALWRAMAQEGATANRDAHANGAAVRKVIDGRKGEPLRFGVVHPYSAHNYELRYWLAAKRGAHLATVKATIWKSSPEKVLGVNARWGETNPEALAACS